MTFPPHDPVIGQITMPHSPEMEARAADILQRLRERGVTVDYDSVLSSLEEVEAHAGPTQASQTFVGSNSATLTLQRAIDLRAWTASQVVQSPAVQPSITIRERRNFVDELTLLGTDEWLATDAWTLRRMDGWGSWGAVVQVDYRAVVDQSLRDQVALSLAELNIETNVHKTEQLGDYRVSDDGADLADRRAELLSQLTEGKLVCEAA